jgi:hypothetical protein
MTMSTMIHDADGRLWTRAGLAGVLAIAGVIHLLLTPDHLAESTLFGLGFATSAGAQFGLAAVVLLRPERWVYAAIIAVSVVLMGLYAYNVMVGLPLHAGAAAEVADSGSDEGHDGHLEESAGLAASATDHEDGHPEHEATEDAHGEHGEDGLVLGAGEPVDAWGAATQLAELSAIGLALLLLRRSRPRSPQRA